MRFIRFLCVVSVCASGAPPSPSKEWRAVGGAPGYMHYSPLNAINRKNVAKLKVAWTYDTGDAFDVSEMQCNPIVVGGLLYATTPKLRLLALDAATGKLRWAFDPFDGNPPRAKFRNRGVMYWE